MAEDGLIVEPFRVATVDPPAQPATGWASRVRGRCGHCEGRRVAVEIRADEDCAKELGEEQSGLSSDERWDGTRSRDKVSTI